MCSNKLYFFRFIFVSFQNKKRISSIPQHKRKLQRTERNSESISFHSEINCPYGMYVSCQPFILLYDSLLCELHMPFDVVVQPKDLTKQHNNKISVTVKWYKCNLKRKTI